MTQVTLSLSPSEIEFSHPITEELVIKAAPYIRQQLNAVLREHDDSETREEDPRRTHAPLSRSHWLIQYRGNSIKIINRIDDEHSKQFRALVHGNGPGPICSRHMTQRTHRAWSSKDRHKSVVLGGKKPVPGTKGGFYPGVMKYYDKKDGMWEYSRCVKPICSDVIEDVNRQIRRAVFIGLETARWDYNNIRDTELDAGEPEVGVASDVGEAEVTIEELARTTVETLGTDVRNTVEKIERDKAEELENMDARSNNRALQERARSELQKVGLAPANKKAGVPKRNKGTRKGES